MTREQLMHARHPAGRWEFWFSVVAGMIALVTASVAAQAPATAKGDPIIFEFALYFSPKPSADPAQELRRLLADHTLRLRALDAADFAEAMATVSPHWVPLADYAPPSASSFRFFGLGVEAEEAPKLAAAERVFILVFSTPQHGALVANRSACALLADLAQATQGRIWDEETRQLYSVERWRADRLESWQGNLPDLTKHVTMHAYANPELVRIITLGMRKFGLPDLVVAEIPSQHTRPFGNFINAFMQRLVEGQRPDDSKMMLTLADIRHVAVRSRSLENPGKGARGVVLVSTRLVAPEQGDPKNTLWQLDFPEAKFSGTTERAMWGANELFGSTDSVTGVAPGDPEMAAARARARKAFFAQEDRFRAGLDFKEHLIVKAPFVAGVQTEYMWVEVVKWGEKILEGVLTSDPYYVKNIRAGSRVTVRLDDIYDYILYKPDGTQEGNETGRLLELREKK